MKTVRVGVIGLGVMGMKHARTLAEGAIRGGSLAAVCDVSEERLAAFHDDVFRERDVEGFLRSGRMDAVVVATPHFSHVPLGVAVLEAGLHLLVEKPLAVHKADAERLVAAHRGRKQVFTVMLNQRTDPRYRKVRELITGGELGELVRVNWTVTTWFRTEHYYREGGWRATWEGEGGGVLLNQCPHQLDLLQWLCGMPSRVTGFCGIGRRHRIEVEDEVTAFLEYPNGATGVFVTSTGEWPGVNRLEIVGDRGRLVVEGENVHFTRNEVPTREVIRTCKEGMPSPAVWEVKIPVQGKGEQHAGILQNFVDAIAGRAPLVARGEEGMHSVELANAMLYSSLLGKTVELPMDGAAYERKLKQLIRRSRQCRRRRRPSR
jgi:predicted dehydrogenase